MAIKRLTVAYRSRSRPSSTLGAKASTVCPYYLDGDLTDFDLTPLAERLVSIGPVIPVLTPRLSMGGHVASVQFSRTVESHFRRPAIAYFGHAFCGHVPRAPADAGLSKLNSTLG